jgi:hypothetical protein
MEATVLCPACKTEIKLTESLAAPLIEATRQQYEKKIAEQNGEVAKREQAIKAREEQLAKEKESVDAAVEEKLKQERAKLVADAAKREQAFKDRDAALLKEKDGIDAAVAEKLKTERARIAADESKKAKLAIGNDLEEKTKEIADLNEVLKLRDGKLAEAQKAQAELIRKQRELDDAKRETDLTIETRVQESLAKVRDLAKKDAEQELSLKVIEKDQTIDSMKKQIDDLKRRAEQGSQQLQGEALELQLESVLSRKFPHDQIEPVAKGEHGGDILQRVISPTGSRCGTILWETKRTKNWNDGWLAKLREDQRQAKAEIAVIASTVLPRDVDSFDQIDGVWIVHPKCVLPVAMSLRHMLMEVSAARSASEGQQTKMEIMYGYLTGPKFRLRVQAIVEAFSTMGEDLIKEKKATLRQWAKREEQIHRVMDATVGMYGELQGIAGKSLGQIEGLEMDAAQAGTTALPVTQTVL